MKKITVCCLATAIGWTIIGCGNIEKSVPEEKKQKTTVLEVYVQQSETDNLERLKKAFEEKNKNIEISVNPVLDSEYIKEMMKIKNEELEADCIFFPDMGAANLWQEKSILLDLSPWYQESTLFSCYQNWYANMDCEDGYYLMPYQIKKTCVFYNKSLFDEFGVLYPKTGWTWEDFKETALKLTGWGEHEKVYGVLGFDSSEAIWTLPARTLGAASPFEEEDLEKFRETALWSYNFSKELSDAFPYFSQTDIEESYYTNLFLEGKTAMLFANDSEAIRLNRIIKEERKALDYDVAELPSWGETEYQPVFDTAAAGIAENSEHPEAAYQFLEFCTGNEGAEILAENGVVPALQTEKVCKIYTENVRVPEHREYFLERTIPAERITEPLHQGGWEIMQNQVMLYFAEQQDWEYTFACTKKELEELDRLNFE